MRIFKLLALSFFSVFKARLALVSKHFGTVKQAVPQMFVKTIFFMTYAMLVHFVKMKSVV